MELDELLIHKAICLKPELIEHKLGIRLDKKSLMHHYPLSSKGEHIDFVFKDISGNTYLAEVKLNVSPINVIPQLYEHEYKKFIAISGDLDHNKIFPVIVTDNESVSDEDIDILSKMNIKLCTYNLEEIQKILKKEEVHEEPPISLEFPEIEGIEDFLNKVKILKENFGDLNILLEGFKGKMWWDGYYDFRAFWLWKEGKYPELHQKLFRLLCEGKREDCIWFTFLNAISDSAEVAQHIVFHRGWFWSQTMDVGNDKTRWGEFEDCLCNSGKWCIQALFDHQKRKQVVKDYLKMVGESQERYFLGIMSKANNPFDAYNSVRESIFTIHNVGNVVAGIFATYLSQWRILPIISSDQVRESKFVRKALDSIGIRQPMESYRDAMLRLAKKYSVSPLVIERAMHKLGRIGTEETSED